MGRVLRDGRIWVPSEGRRTRPAASQGRARLPGADVSLTIWCRAACLRHRGVRRGPWWYLVAGVYLDFAMHRPGWRRKGGQEVQPASVAQERITAESQYEVRAPAGPHIRWGCSKVDWA